jgi:serine/threonine protein kinase
MPVRHGQRLGHYEITGLLGQGGMGQVWRAHHVALGRDDALKVLPDTFAADPERLSRFQREAQVLASLNHSNIAQVYGLQDVDGTPAIVMELVEGLTLADRIAQGPLALDEALAIARQITLALEAAHEHGVIHRDLKPSNIKLRPDGTVKVLDFGLAKVFESEGRLPSASSMSPTITSPALLTGVGVILGTAAYASPEQARGKAVDKRADIWAFGVVLYEAVTGRRLFQGEDLTETIAAVVKSEPDLSGVPPQLRRLLRKCLEKDPRKRLRDIGDAWELLDAEPAAVAAVPTRRQPLLPWVFARAPDSRVPARSSVRNRVCQHLWCLCAVPRRAPCRHLREAWRRTAISLAAFAGFDDRAAAAGDRDREHSDVVSRQPIACVHRCRGGKTQAD